MSVEVKNQLDADQWRAYGEVYALVGNELLTPMNRSGELRSLDPGFWRQMPLPGNEKGARGLERLEGYAQAASEGDGDDPDTPGMLSASVEYTKLFIGPPRPAADPWETMNDPANSEKVGFGQSTLAMKRLLAEEGLEIAGASNQYEDHMGIELLYLSALCEKATRGGEPGASAARKAAWFIAAHPLMWMGRFRVKVDEVAPHGYYSALLEYVDGVLEDHLASLVD